MEKAEPNEAGSLVVPPSLVNNLFIPFERLHEIIGVRYSRMSIWRMVRAKTFPAPRQISPQRIAWRVEDLIAWNASRPVAKSASKKVAAHG